MLRINYKTPKQWAILLVLAILCFGPIHAQKTHTLSKSQLIEQTIGVHHAEKHPAGCAHDEMMKDLYKLHPEMEAKQEQLNNLVRERIYGNNSLTGEPINSLSGTVYTIPVVVHVVHEAGVPVGTGENLSAAVIQQGIDDMTNAFRNSGAYNDGSGYDVEIEFCLASQDPSGNFTTGITRTESTEYSNLAIETEDATLKSASVAEQWDPTKYCNIWLVKEICDTSGSCGVAGYAYLASSHGQAWDGIVNEAAYFGSSTNNSKVHIHEMGHYLNLYHTFNIPTGESACQNNDCTADGDFVCDTPPDNSTTAISCSSTANSCTTDTNSGFSSDQNDMIENYMDYGFQSCQIWFTAGQSTRMRDALVNTRTSLLSSNGCVNPTTPSIYFDVASMSVSEEATTVAGSCGSYRDVTITMGIGAAPTGDATVTFAYAGTAGSDIDYQSTTGPEITFTSGSSTDQTFNLRIWDDGSVEGSETIEITYTIGGTTDAVAASFNQTLTITINDDDSSPDLAGTVNLISEDFESGFPSGWTVGIFGGSSANANWSIGSGGVPSTTSLYMASSGTRGDDASEAKRLGILTSSIDASAITSTMELSFYLDVGGSNENDYFEIFYNNNNNGDGWQIHETNIHTQSGIYTSTLPSALQGSSFQIGLIWNQNGDGSITGNVPAFDDVVISYSDAGVAVQSNLCSTDFYFGPNDTVYVYNNDSVLAKLINLSSHDYGCTTFEVDRTGTSAEMYENPASNSYPASKTFKITPTTNNPSGSYKICLYYSEAEILGWEAATGNSRTDLGLLKASDPIDDVSGTQALGTSPVNGAYNTDDYYVEATFSTGFSGFGAISQSNSPLPIELLHWKAQLIDDAVSLEWEAIEIPGFDYYEVERSTDGQNFERIHMQMGSDVFNVAQSYVYNDPVAHLKGSATLYYRLKNVEQDGSFVYSEVRAIQLPNEEAFGFTQVQPNPFNNSITVSLTMKQAADVTLDVISVDGRVLRRLNLTDLGDAGTIHLNNLADLKAGIYFLQLNSSDGRQAFEKVVKY